MGFFSRLGNKLSHAYDSVSRVGMKALSGASRIGHKVSEVGHSVVDTLKASPLSMVPGLSTAINVGDKVLGLVDKGTAMADRGLKVAKDVDSVVSGVRSRLEKKPTASVDAGLQKHSSGTAGSSLRDAVDTHSVSGKRKKAPLSAEALRSMRGGR